MYSPIWRTEEIPAFSRGARRHCFPKQQTTGRTQSGSASDLASIRPGAGPSHAEIHHSDQGVQYAATAYTALLQTAGVQISMAEVGAAWQNGYAERLMRTIKEEEVDVSDYGNYADVVKQVGRFLDEVYMYKRIHSSLGYLTPAEFESQWRVQQARQTNIH